MSLESELLALENALWTGGRDEYLAVVDDRCLLAFAPRAGVSSREEVADSVADGPRWEDPRLEVMGLLRPLPGLAILTYRARARRAGESYHALVSSAYVRRDDAWRLAFHQHTPLPSG